jgi:heme-degrading monooxygenase HmoA
MPRMSRCTLGWFNVRQPTRAISASSQPASDGTGVAAVYFKDQESIEAWAKDPEHQVAKRKGRETWYSHYMIRICRVEREYGRPDR